MAAEASTGERRVRVGVIGVGSMGRRHALLYRGLANAELVGVYDIVPETTQAVATEAGCRPFGSAEELAAEVEALSVAVPSSLHAAVTCPLLARGLHVLLEKPIAVTGAEARRVVRAAEAAGVVLAVGHVERFNPVLEPLRGARGPLAYIEARRLAPYPPPRPGAVPRCTDVTVVHDLMIHDLDVVLSLVRSPLRRIDACGTRILSASEDVATARLEFANGCVAQIVASRVSDTRVRSLEVVTPDAWYSLDYAERKGEVRRTANGQVVREVIPPDARNPLELELADFCRAVLDRLAGRPGPGPRVDGRQGLAALCLVERVLRQARRHRERVERGG